MGLSGIVLPQNYPFENLVLQARASISIPANALNPSTLMTLMFGLGMYILAPDMPIPTFGCSHEEIDLLVDSRERVGE